MHVPYFKCVYFAGILTNLIVWSALISIERCHAQYQLKFQLDNWSPAIYFLCVSYVLNFNNSIFFLKRKKYEMKLKRRDKIYHVWCMRSWLIYEWRSYIYSQNFWRKKRQITSLIYELFYLKIIHSFSYVLMWLKSQLVFSLKWNSMRCLQDDRMLPSR